MEVQTDSERVRTSRKVVLEFLGSSVDVSLAGPAVPDGTIHDYMARYGADPTRFGEPAPAAAAGERDAHDAGHHHAPPSGEAAMAATVAQPTKIDNDLYVRDYSKCILCYKCVEACGEDAQNTFAIAVAGRGFDARISTEQAVPLPGVGVRLLRQLHRRLPDRRADGQARVRHARRRHVGPVAADRHRDHLPVLRRRLRGGAPRPGRPDPQGHVTARLVRDRRSPVHQGPLRVRVRQRATAQTRRRPAPT